MFMLQSSVIRLGLAAALCGCTVTYPELGPATARGVVSRQFLPDGQQLPYNVSQQTDGELLGIRLAPASCRTQTVEQSTATETTYKKATFVGSFGLMIGGAAVAGLGTALFASSKNYPTSCPAADSECTSRDQARGVSYVAWGLGAAGVVFGLYRAIESPKVVASRTIDSEREISNLNAACDVPVRQVPVTLLADGYNPYSVNTDSTGLAVFQLHMGKEPRYGTVLISGWNSPLRIDLSAFADSSSDPSPPPGPTDTPEDECHPDDWSMASFPWSLLNGRCEAFVDKAQVYILKWGVQKAADRLAEEFTDSPDWRPVLSFMFGRILKELALNASNPARKRSAAAVCCALRSQVLSQ